ncbi:DNA polymerase epsilon subunit 2-like [Planoprotostelium fungivorum]|uniref:DNA polymerase epsilon subunit n=1 Tax=Planoprotostelium fungivorum TaxID=1890364 RepID=A0A2P6N525_9EUKA|nr:DNA polymerase epsilon subunit 2-like [Planoprotostelium fungivorum]
MCHWVSTRHSFNETPFTANPNYIISSSYGYRLLLFMNAVEVEEAFEFCCLWIEEKTPSIRVINAEDFPKYKWNTERKLFRLYYLAYNRVKRHPAFNNAKEKRDVMRRHHFDHLIQQQLTPVDALLGSPGVKFVLGMLTQLKEGQYYLEDMKGNVPITLDKAEFTSGFFVEAEGSFSDADGVFNVVTMSLALGEPKEVSNKSIAGLDLFAPGIVKTTKSKYGMFRSESISERETTIPEDSEILVLSDVHLDDDRVLDKLYTLLSAFEEDSEKAPDVVVFMGNFTSNLKTYSKNIQDLQNGLSRLADIISHLERVTREVQFVFVPGPTDPGGQLSSILPLPPLPSSFTNVIREKLPNAIFTTNPCRIRFHGQDITVFREDVLNKMRRQCIVPPTDTEDCSDPSLHLVKSICDGAHLCPLTMQTRPVHWNLDQSLHLFPLPDTLILSDRYEQYDHIHNGCLAFNPGSFAADFSFVTYFPSDKSVEYSRVTE